jgi:hypothetical protein
MLAGDSSIALAAARIVGSVRGFAEILCVERMYPPTVDYNGDFRPAVAGLTHCPIPRTLALRGVVC